MIAMLPPSSLGNEVTFDCLNNLDARRVRGPPTKKTHHIIVQKTSDSNKT